MPIHAAYHSSENPILCSLHAFAARKFASALGLVDLTLNPGVLFLM